MVRAVRCELEDLLHAGFVRRRATDPIVDQSSHDNQKYQKTKQLVRAIQRVCGGIPDLEIAAAVRHGETNRHGQQQHNHGQPVEYSG